MPTQPDQPRDSKAAFRGGLRSGGAFFLEGSPWPGGPGPAVANLRHVGDRGTDAGPAGVIRDELCRWADWQRRQRAPAAPVTVAGIIVEATMRTPIRQLVLGTASVLALGIAGTALEYAADAGNTMNTASMARAPQTSDNRQTREFLRKDDLRWAQVELRFRGLYRGSLDGILGPETQRALSQFQKINGLDQTGITRHANL